jgi:hypothetical protein
VLLLARGEETRVRVIKERDGGIVRRVRLVGDDGEPVGPVCRFLDHLGDREFSPNTLAVAAGPAPGGRRSRAGTAVTTRIYVLDVPENEDVVKVAARGPAVTVDKVGPYARITAQGDLVIDRRATGCRHAVWYSAVAGLEGSVIARFDKDELRVTAR